MNIGLSDIIGFGAQASSSPSAMMGAAAAHRRRAWTPKRTYAALKVGNLKSKMAAKMHHAKVSRAAKAGSPLAKIWLAKFNALVKANPKLTPKMKPKGNVAGAAPYAQERLNPQVRLRGNVSEALNVILALLTGIDPSPQKSKPSAQVLAMGQKILDRVVENVKARRFPAVSLRDINTLARLVKSHS